MAFTKLFSCVLWRFGFVECTFASCLLFYSFFLFFSLKPRTFNVEQRLNKETDFALGFCNVFCLRRWCLYGIKLARGEKWRKTRKSYELAKRGGDFEVDGLGDDWSRDWVMRNLSDFSLWGFDGFLTSEGIWRNQKLHIAQLNWMHEWIC